ncbi:MAG TPA: hypothetical protein VLK36_08635 [Gaiellaceae bacterium]|nr:hypothetical protein [Gaiellaceae bacterium]
MAAAAGLLWLGFTAAAETATVRGTDAANVLRGTKGADVLYGRKGADSIYGLAGNDTLYGGYGNDRLYGGSGADRLVGGPGNDVLDGGPGRDSISCGGGRDVVNADAADVVARDCEVVHRPPPKHVPPPTTTTTTAATTTTTAATTTTADAPTTVAGPPTTTDANPPPESTAPPTTTGGPPTTTAPSTCGQGPRSYRYSLLNQPLTASSVTVTETINQLPTYPAVGDHSLVYVAVAYGRTADGCAAVGWLQGGIWRGATRFDEDTGQAFLYVEWQTTTSYQLIRLADVTIPSSHTFTLSSTGVGNTWAIFVDGAFVASVELDDAPQAFSTAVEEYSVDGDVWPSYDFTISGASPTFTHAPTGQLPYDSFTPGGWHSTL